MKCAWESLVQILPPRIRQEVDRLGKQTMQELRLRLGKPPELVLGRESIWMDTLCQLDDLNYVINTASRYSPWAAESIQEGYLTSPGGHRIGFCGQVTVHGNQVRGIRQVESLCIRVARDFEGIAAGVNRDGSILIIGPPGSGKTTLLRDLCREISKRETVAVVDERGELFPIGYERGKALDVLSLCPKPEGIDMALRTLGPSTIAVDEITGEDDAQALLRAGWCGVRLVATAHAASIDDLKKRPIYRSLWENRLFEHLLTCHRDKSRPVERRDL